MKKRHLSNAGRNFGFSTYEGYHHKDHFLAKNWSKYSNENLEDYAADFYQLMQDNYEILTERTKFLLACQGGILGRIENPYPLSDQVAIGFQHLQQQP